MGIPCGSLSKEKARRLEEREAKFPFVNLVKVKEELWFNLLAFYGINGDFPADYLYQYQEANAKKIVLLNKGLHGLMGAKKKFKLEVVNLGLKMFSKNRCDKSDGEYRLLQEGLEIILPFMDDRRQVKFGDGKLFTAMTVPEDKMLSFDAISKEFGPEVAYEFTSREKGSAVLRFPSSEGEMLACTVWIGVNNLSLMLNKEEINSLVFLLA